MKISIVIPLYKCSSFITELTERLENTLLKLTNDYEIIYINDASPENDWEMVIDFAKKIPYIKGINLSRNFGQHYAISAGLKYCTGDWVVVMDGDLQDRPEEIVNLFNKARQGFDIVFAKRNVRKDSFVTRYLSVFFYLIFSYLSDTKQDNTIANFGIYSRNVIDAILSMGDNFKYFPVMTQWVGFNKTKINVQHDKRRCNFSSYTFYNKSKLAFNNIIAFSDKLLRITIKIGLSIVIISFLVGIYFLYKYIIGDIKVLGYASIILSIWFLSGFVILIIGIIGIYIGKTFEQTKNRPKFIVKEFLNFDE